MHEPVDFVGFFILGLVGGLGHCLGMCAPFVLYIGRRFAPHGSVGATQLKVQSAYHLGRIVTYAGLGLVAGSAGQLLDLAGDFAGVGPVAQAVAGLVLVLYALGALGGGVPAVARLGARLFGKLSQTLQRQAPRNAFLTGAFLGFLPCGLLYAALIAATAAGNGWRGGVGLILFGVGTAPALLGLSLADTLLVRGRRVLNTIGLVFVFALGCRYLWLAWVD